MTFGSTGMQGWRNTMEDSHISKFNLSDDVHFFGVFDGHGGKLSWNSNKNNSGKEVALLVKDIYLDVLKETEEFKRGDFKEALKKSFV